MTGDTTGLSSSIPTYVTAPSQSTLPANPIDNNSAADPTFGEIPDSGTPPSVGIFAGGNGSPAETFGTISGDSVSCGSCSWDYHAVDATQYQTSSSGSWTVGGAPPSDLEMYSPSFSTIDVGSNPYYLLLSSVYVPVYTPSGDAQRYQWCIAPSFASAATPATSDISFTLDEGDTTITSTNKFPSQYYCDTSGNRFPVIDNYVMQLANGTDWLLFSYQSVGASYISAAQITFSAPTGGASVPTWSLSDLADDGPHLADMEYVKDELNTDASNNGLGSTWPGGDDGYPLIEHPSAVPIQGPSGSYCGDLYYCFALTASFGEWDPLYNSDQSWNTSPWDYTTVEVLCRENPWASPQTVACQSGGSNAPGPGGDATVLMTGAGGLRFLSNACGDVTCGYLYNGDSQLGIWDPYLWYTSTDSIQRHDLVAPFTFTE